MATNVLDSARKACSAVQAIRAKGINQLNLLHQRFEAARRAVILMRGLANNSLLPIIPNLPAIAEIDLSAYNHIRLACPGLNLPAVDAGTLSRLPGISQVENLRSKYQNAVRDLLDQMERSPLGAIDQLENELNKKIDDLLKGISDFNQWINCICAGVDEMTNPANVRSAQIKFNELTKKPTLIDEELTGKMSSFRETKTQLQKIVSPNPQNPVSLRNFS